MAFKIFVLSENVDFLIIVAARVNKIVKIVILIKDGRRAMGCELASVKLIKIVKKRFKSGIKLEKSLKCVKKM